MNTHTKPRVYFAAAQGEPGRNKFDRISELLQAASVNERFRAGDLVAVKVHWGEIGNADFIPSFFVRHIVDEVKKGGAIPFVTDTNTLYRGTRHDAVSNLKTAAQHGFTPETVGAPLLVADGLRGSDYREVPVPGVHTQSARVATAISEADGMVVVSHVKGHMVFGYAGALKNLGMGCSPSGSKQFLHANIRPRVDTKRCTGCGTCFKHCHFDAITMHSSSDGAHKKAQIDLKICTGCGECVGVCPEEAIPIDWGGKPAATQEKTAEYACGVVAGKEGRCLYINFLTAVVPDCDCSDWSDRPMVPDLGYLVSTDPVAIDQASIDLVLQAPVASWMKTQEDPFLAAHPIDYRPILEHAERLGMGHRAYELINLESSDVGAG